MKFLLGIALLTAAASAFAESYNGAPYPTLNGGVPDYGSDGYRRYATEQSEAANAAETARLAEVLRSQSADMAAERRHNELMQQLQQLQPPAQEEGWRPR